ncbi:hypothetical protein FRP1_01690 [Pseudonocardia sp. EC080625-04]|uniref:hypothetical protein n=1 Tax=Pseudonocardia sp. EC080625-04 TaxID=1096868 RepID=UPI0006CAFBCA|nr:hypothetical protein [Pseudonocardia sp. EC080625-04]ALE72170.1 hypothetical protein FRP1_01690 [Pseudonocardia sp. EC080625-04]
MAVVSASGSSSVPAASSGSAAPVRTGAAGATSTGASARSSTATPPVVVPDVSPVPSCSSSARPVRGRPATWGLRMPPVGRRRGVDMR